MESRLTASRPNFEQAHVLDVHTPVHTCLDLRCHTKTRAPHPCLVHFDFLSNGTSAEC